MSNCRLSLQNASENCSCTAVTSSPVTRTETKVTFRLRHATSHELSGPFPERPFSGSRRRIRIAAAGTVLHAARRTDDDEIGVRRLRIITTAQRRRGRRARVGTSQRGGFVRDVTAAGGVFATDDCDRPLRTHQLLFRWSRNVCCYSGHRRPNGGQRYRAQRCTALVRVLCPLFAWMG